MKVDRNQSARTMLRLVLLAALILAPVIASAETLEDHVVAQLAREGYSEIKISRTLLRKVRIQAKSEFGTRDIVFHPRSGTIVHDTFLWDVDRSHKGHGAFGEQSDSYEDAFGNSERDLEFEDQIEIEDGNGFSGND